jgi:hypothetical protein
VKGTCSIPIAGMDLYSLGSVLLRYRRLGLGDLAVVHILGLRVECVTTLLRHQWLKDYSDTWF